VVRAGLDDAWYTGTAGGLEDGDGRGDVVVENALPGGIGTRVGRQVDDRVDSLEERRDRPEPTDVRDPIHAGSTPEVATQDGIVLLEPRPKHLPDLPTHSRDQQPGSRVASGGGPATHRVP